MELYVSPAEYHKLCPDGEIPEKQLASALSAAQMDIDSLTYNRIVSRGFAGLTKFQQDSVQVALCRQANFLYEYGEVISSPLSSYGINGVSMSFDPGRTVQHGGVITLPGIAALLRQTGLTFRGVSG